MGSSFPAKVEHINILIVMNIMHEILCTDMALVKMDIWSGRAEEYLSLCVVMQIIDVQYCERY